ncbi:MAG: hypothetical protein LBM23_10560 [Propionibacteriaceae bacterium]|jgi:hypothetical protein|nr:hypothetical protein [Propionibacteriaceae bacterium]
MTTDDDGLTLAQRRNRDAKRLEELMAGQTLHEATQAQELIDAFVVQAKKQGIPTEPLVARTISGQPVKTTQEGWYLRNDHSVAIGVDGSYYQLTVAAPGFLERFRGITVPATPPPLVVARGGRDGETGDLRWFLDRVLGRVS